MTDRGDLEAAVFALAGDREAAVLYSALEGYQRAARRLPRVTNTGARFYILYGPRLALFLPSAGWIQQGGGVVGAVRAGSQAKDAFYYSLDRAAAVLAEEVRSRAAGPAAALKIATTCSAWIEQEAGRLLYYRDQLLQGAAASTPNTTSGRR